MTALAHQARSRRRLSRRLPQALCELADNQWNIQGRSNELRGDKPVWRSANLYGHLFGNQVCANVAVHQFDSADAVDVELGSRSIVDKTRDWRDNPRHTFPHFLNSGNSIAALVGNSIAQLVAVPALIFRDIRALSSVRGLQNSLFVVKARREGTGILMPKARLRSACLPQKNSHQTALASTANTAPTIMSAKSGALSDIFSISSSRLNGTAPSREGGFASSAKFPISVVLRNRGVSSCTEYRPRRLRGQSKPTDQSIRLPTKWSKTSLPTSRRLSGQKTQRLSLPLKSAAKSARSNAISKAAAHGPAMQSRSSSLKLCGATQCGISKSNQNRRAA